MSSLSQLIFNVRNANSGGKSHRALGATDRQIAYWIKLARAAILYATIQKKGEVHPEYEVDFGCMRLTKVDQADCEKFKWGELVKKVEIPAMIAADNNAGLTFFGLIDKQTMIYLSDKSWGDLDEHMPYKKKKFFEASQIGTTAYVYPSKVQGSSSNQEAYNRLMDLCVVNVRGVPEDPTEVMFCENETCEPRCFDWDTDRYPFPVHLEGAMNQFIEDNYVKEMAQFPEDTKNNEKKESVV